MQTQRTRTTAIVLQNSNMMFIISSYLPGEYVLRVFPVLCKSTQSLRFSLHLLGGASPKTVPASMTTSTMACYLEGFMYGVYSIWRDFQRIIASGHTLNSLLIQDDLLSTTKSLSIAFSCLERLCLPDGRLPKPFSIDRFPKLTKIEIHRADDGTAKKLLQGVWEMPLTSLIISIATIRMDTEKEARGPPAFARSLRCLESKTEALFNILLPYCHSLETLSCKSYHRIIAKNLGLTSLALSDSGPDVPDLTPLLLLVKFVCGSPCFVTHAAQSNLKYISLKNPQPSYAKIFLAQCPALEHATLVCSNWQHLVQMSTALNPAKCKLVLAVNDAGKPPPLGEVVQYLLKRGFHINEDFLLCTSEAKDNWENIAKMTPSMQRWEAMQCGIEQLLHPVCLASFPALSVLDINSQSLPWDQQLVSTLIKYCPLLRELAIHADQFSGELQIDSLSLCKLKLQFTTEFSNFIAHLPNLTFLGFHLRKREGIFLQKILGTNPTIRVPRLRVLDIVVCNFPANAADPPLSVFCDAKHGSLAHFRLHGARQLQISKLFLRNLPQLRAISLNNLPPNIQVRFDLPGDCDISLSCLNTDYTRQGLSSRSNIRQILNFNARHKRWDEFEK